MTSATSTLRLDPATVDDHDVVRRTSASSLSQVLTAALCAPPHRRAPRAADGSTLTLRSRSLTGTVER